MDSTTTRLYSFLHRNAVMIEVTLLLLSLVSILLYYFDIPSSNLLLVRSINLAAIVYVFFACFDPFEGKDYKITDVRPKIIAIGFSLAVLGAWFKLMHYPRQELALKIGVISMFAALIAGFTTRRNWSNNLVALVIKTSLITTLGLVLWFF